MNNFQTGIMNKNITFNNFIVLLHMHLWLQGGILGYTSTKDARVKQDVLDFFDLVHFDVHVFLLVNKILIRMSGFGKNTF